MYLLQSQHGIQEVGQGLVQIDFKSRFCQEIIALEFQTTNANLALVLTIRSSLFAKKSYTSLTNTGVKYMIRSWLAGAENL